MRSLEDMAKNLSALFQEAGNFVDAPGPMGERLVPANTRGFFESEIIGFAGLSVRAVGFANAREREDLHGVHIYVTRGSQRDLRSLPDEFQNTPIHPHKLGPIHVKPRASSVSTHRGHVFEYNGRIACGSSCAPATTNYSGTFGAIVKRKGGAMFALSNNHVFGDCNHMPVGQPIMVPSNQDAGPKIRSPQEIGRHSEISELRSGTPLLVPKAREDAALAEVTHHDDVTSWQGDKSDGYDTPAKVAEPIPGMRVKKFGRTTGLTVGEVESLQVDFTLPYDSDQFRAVVWFEKVWSVKRTGKYPFALPGDSGSLVVTEDGKSSIGLLFAATSRGEYGFIVPISHVLARFGSISLVSKHGV